MFICFTTKRMLEKIIGIQKSTPRRLKAALVSLHVAGKIQQNQVMISVRHRDELAPH